MLTLSVCSSAGKMTSEYEIPLADTARSVFRPHRHVVEGILEALPVPPSPALLLDRSQPHPLPNLSHVGALRTRAPRFGKLINKA